MLYGDTLTLIKQKITNIVVFESRCSRPKGVCLSGVMSEWSFVRVGFGPSGVHTLDLNISESDLRWARRNEEEALKLVQPVAMDASNG